jgi:KDO2-lipid IV(A) lauroyltransferase
VRVSELGDALPADAADAAAVINRAMEGLILQCPQQYLWGYQRYKRPRRGALGSSAGAPPAPPAGTGASS